MLYAGCDLHKQTISVCVMNPARQIVKRERLRCADETAIRRFFEELGEFEAVVEATASYEWFVRLIEPFARRVVLAHPKKLRVIAESTRKSDRLDSQVLAEFLALDMIPAEFHSVSQFSTASSPLTGQSMTDNPQKPKRCWPRWALLAATFIWLTALVAYRTNQRSRAEAAWIDQASEAGLTMGSADGVVPGESERGAGCETDNKTLRRQSSRPAHFARFAPLACFLATSSHVANALQNEKCLS